MKYLLLAISPFVICAAIWALLEIKGPRNEVTFDKCVSMYNSMQYSEMYEIGCDFVLVDLYVGKVRSGKY